MKSKKVTLATVKAFIRRNRATLLIKTHSSFDGMVDCVMDTGEREFTPASNTDNYHDNNQGIRGVWFVGGSRNWFIAFDRGGLVGYETSNCCGKFSVAVRA